MNYYSNNGFNPNNNVRYSNNYQGNYSSVKPYINNGYYNDKNNDRIIGTSFLGPFVLGGITGGLVAPYFYRPYPQPYPMPYPPRYW